MSMAQRYADYLEREARQAATPVKAEAMRQAANKLRELEIENNALRADAAANLDLFDAEPTRCRACLL